MEELRGLENGIRTAEKADLERVSRLLESKYEVVGLIGSGGMGNVYYGRSKADPALEVAIKVLHPEFVSDPTLCARFIREAELLQKVQHPGIVAFYDARSENGIAYYVMECVIGVSLEQLIRKNSVPLEEVPELVIKICEALHAVHSVGIIHRDLKPANIMVLESYDIKLTDFGIARPENSQLTHHNEIVGSVCYIPPEIWIGEDPTPSVDLYSLGIVMYELLTGKVPFDGSSPGDLMRKHLQSIPEPPKDSNPAIPSYLNRITLSLLSKSKLDRPKDALSVIEKIQKARGATSSTHTFTGYKQDTEEFLRVLEVSNNEDSENMGAPSASDEKIAKAPVSPSILSEQKLEKPTKVSVEAPADKEPESSEENEMGLLETLTTVEKIGIAALFSLLLITSGSLVYFLL